MTATTKFTSFSESMSQCHGHYSRDAVKASQPVKVILDNGNRLRAPSGLSFLAAEAKDDELDSHGRLEFWGHATYWSSDMCTARLRRATRGFARCVTSRRARY